MNNNFSANKTNDEINNLTNNVLGGRGIRRIMETWLNRQSAFDLWRNNRGFGYYKSIIKRLHYKPADSGYPIYSFEKHFSCPFENELFECLRLDSL
jgi:hypothetical protein